MPQQGVVTIYGNVPTSSSIGKISKSEALTIYPNPAINKICIEQSQSMLTNYSITTIQGEVISSGIFEEKTHQIDVSELKQGVYVLTVDGLRKKFLKL